MGWGIGPPPRSDWTRNEDSAKAELNERLGKQKKRSSSGNRIANYFLILCGLIAGFYLL